MRILNGIAGLFASRKGTLCILMISAMTVCALFGHLDGIGYSAACSVITAVYLHNQRKLDELGKQQ